MKIPEPVRKIKIYHIHMPVIEISPPYDVH